jgi:hypothetical protein
MVRLLASGAVDHRFIGGVMVSMLASGAVDHGFIGAEASILTITPPMNP